MAGQGTTIKRIAGLLRDGGWQVVYVCVPNTCHVGVVPIPTNGGATAQRYPDILSVKGNNLRLSEVEMSLTEDVGRKAIERFNEQRKALLSRDVYTDWRARVLELTGAKLPLNPYVICELILCARPDTKLTPVVANVEEHHIAVVAATDYEA